MPMVDEYSVLPIGYGITERRSNQNFQMGESHYSSASKECFRLVLKFRKPRFFSIWLKVFERKKLF